MKRLLLIALICISFLFAPCLSFADTNPYVIGVPSTQGGGCSSTPTDSFTSIEDSRTSGNNYTSNLILTGGSGYDVCRIDIHFGHGAGDTSDYYVEFRSDNAGSPGSVLGTSDTVLNASAPLTGSNDYVQFDFPTPFSITSATNYHYVIHGDSGSVSLSLTTGNTTPEHIQGSADGSSWSDVSTSRAVVYRLYGEN